ncbi:MAG: GTPase Era [Lachnospiraceae bacterium]|nr:GTPase Era [Lachnospiraceae bacterium]
MEEMKKSGFVSIIGRPNVGKSTLLNAIAGQKVAITSNKPQTTRNRIRAIHTSQEGQIVFVDTPGMIGQTKNKLGEYMMAAAKSALHDSDVILWLIEPSSYIGEEDRKIAGLLGKSDAPVILIINKIDTIPKEQILSVIDSFRSLMDFAEIIPVSALRGKGVEEVTGTIFRYLPYGPLYYEEDAVTDQTERQIAAEMIREKALHALDKEVPHGLAVVIDTMTEREKTGKDGEKETITEIEATIICERESHKAIVIGKGGAMLRKIGTNARYEIEKMTGNKVYLKLFVKVRTNWRDSLTQVRNFGYDRREI